MSMLPPVSDPVIHTVHASTGSQERSEIAEVIEAARSLLAQGDAEAAMQRLRPVFDEDRAQAQVRSWYGLTLGLSRRRYHEALDLCQSAVKQEFFNPELYVNIAQLNLAFGFKAESLRYLRRARMIDPGNQSIRQLLEDLGPRRTPVLGFLPRGHVINRWLGSVRHVLVSRGEAPDPEDESFEAPPHERAVV